MAILTMLLVIVLHLALPSEAVHSIDYPEDWKGCLRNIKSVVNVDKEDGALTVTTCLNQYLFMHGFNTWHPEPTPEYDTFKQEFSQVSRRELNKNGNNRVNRALEEETIRTRKEYRMLSKKEKKRLHRALKKIWSNGTYEHIVNYHANSRSIPVAHGGPGFPSWHRIYLMRLEDELRKYEPDLAFPYWDCRIEADLYEESLGPHWSKLWSKGYAGYGADIVTQGPFKHWQLRRRFGDGGLPNRRRIEKLFNATKEEVTSLPYWNTVFGILELIHNSIHMWVGGDMTAIAFAPKDPVFFLLHSFIDYLWEQLRVHYKDKYDVNPEENFPDISNFSPQNQAYHDEDGPLPGFEPLTVKDGYSNQWTRDVYNYELSPADKDCSECSDNDRRKKCKNICGNNLKCKGGKCVAKLLNPTFFEEFSTEFQPPTSRTRRETTSEDQCHDGVCDYAEPSIQNDFMCNGEDDTNNFRWVPIKVLHRRPRNQKYNTYAVHDSHIDTSYDIFDPVLYSVLDKELHAGDSGTYDQCLVQSVQSYVVVRSDSLSVVSTPQIEKCPFSGKYAFDTEYAYLAVVNPEHGPVNVSFIAYDQCGRLCTPYCRQADDQFKRCTGLFHLDGSYDGYGANPSEVMNKQLYENNGLPDLNDDKVFLIFDCDASTEYFFDRFL